MEKIKVIIKEPGEAARVDEIPNTLENLQKAVGGCIETVTVADDLVLVCDEEGWIKDLPYNVTLFGHQFFGTLLVAGVRGDEFASVPGDINEVKKLIFGE